MITDFLENMNSNSIFKIQNTILFKSERVALTLIETNSSCEDIQNDNQLDAY